MPSIQTASTSSFEKIAFGEFLEQAFVGFDLLARDLAFGDADGLGHFGKDLLIWSSRDAVDQNVEHPIGEAVVFAHRLVSRDFNLAGLARFRLAFAESRLVDVKLTLLESDSTLLRAVIVDVTPGFLALLLRSCDLRGAHDQDGFDRGPSLDVDEVVDRSMSVFD
ncbi:MAG: hypothetical protein NVSMB14_12630 [Isosphaeraceae bacterium]